MEGGGAGDIQTQISFFGPLPLPLQKLFIILTEGKISQMCQVINLSGEGSFVLQLVDGVLANVRCRNFEFLSA